MSTKKSWPECVGMRGEDAKALIAKEFSGSIQIGSVYSAYLANYDPSRVRVKVDEEDKVKYPPHTG